MALSTIYNLRYSVNRDELTILKYKKGRSGPEFGEHVCALEENIKHLADSEYCSSLMTKQFIEGSEFDDRIQAVKENVENSSISLVSHPSWCACAEKGGGEGERKTRLVRCARFSFRLPECWQGHSQSN